MEEGPGLRVRERTAADDTWVMTALTGEWGSTAVVSRGRLHRADRLPGLIAESGGQRVGLLTYEIRGGALEVVSLQAAVRRLGVGRALLEAARGVARRAGCRRLWLVTTNDNREAMEFYRALGLRHVATHRGAVREARELKPEIPATGAGGVPIEDELEFAEDLGEGP